MVVLSWPAAYVFYIYMHSVMNFFPFFVFQSPFCRLSVDHYHQIPKLSTPLSKTATATFAKNAKPGKTQPQFPKFVKPTTDLWTWCVRWGFPPGTQWWPCSPAVADWTPAPPPWSAGHWSSGRSTRASCPPVDWRWRSPASCHLGNRSLSVLTSPWPQV